MQADVWTSLSVVWQELRSNSDFYAYESESAEVCPLALLLFWKVVIYDE